MSRNMQVAKWDTRIPCAGIKFNLSEHHPVRMAWHTACQASQPHKDLELPPLCRTVPPTPHVRHMSALAHSNRKLTAMVHRNPVHTLDSPNNRCKVWCLQANPSHSKFSFRTTWSVRSSERVARRSTK